MLNTIATILLIKNDYITIDINTLKKVYNAHSVKHNMNYISADRNNKLY